MNPGVINTLSSLDPLFMAIIDFILFGQKLKYYHIIGVAAIVACSVIISLSDYFTKKDGAPVLDA